MKAIKNNILGLSKNESGFRYFEFKKCVIITQPKIASRYMDMLYHQNGGVSMGDLRIKKKPFRKHLHDELEMIQDTINTESEYIGNNILDIKRNKKEIIFLTRNPEHKLYSALVQILFFNDDPDLTETLLKSYSLISQKPHQYTVDIMQRYYELCTQCNQEAVSSQNDFFVKNEFSESDKILNDTELIYIRKFHEYKFYSTFEKIISDTHTQPSCANLQRLLNIVLSDKLIAKEKIKLIDISSFSDSTSYFHNLDIPISKRTIRGESNLNLYSLVDQFFSPDDSMMQNVELKQYYSQFLFFENTIYNHLNFIYN